MLDSVGIPCFIEDLREVLTVIRYAYLAMLTQSCENLVAYNVFNSHL
jgi:hypothetical protein